MIPPGGKDLKAQAFRSGGPLNWKWVLIGRGFDLGQGSSLQLMVISL